MTVTVRARHQYSHPVAKVWKVFTTPEFYQDKFEGVGARNVEVLSSDSGDGEFSIETTREVPLDVPSVLKTFLGEWNAMLQNEHWVEEDGEYLNELEMSGDGVPARMTGSMRLKPSGKGCVNEVEITIKAQVPLVGKKLEAFIAKGTEGQLAAEYDFIRGYLKKNK